jgi:raffinose/stachyose/melibiose transport system permease protein
MSQHSRRARIRPTTLLARTVTWAAAVAFSIPIYLLIVISLKTPAQIASDPFGLPWPPQFDNYVQAWERSAGTGTASLSQSLLNSVIITGTTVVILILVGALAGYYLGRRRSRFSTAVYLSFLAGITLPIQLAVVPLYTTFDQLGLLGNPVAVVAFYAGFLAPFSTFLFTGFVRGLPEEFDEAARLDGASWLQTFVLVILPLLRPVISTVAILTAIAVWNDFFGQLVLLLGSGNETLPLTVFTFSGQYSTQYNLLTAGLVIAIIPIATFYLLLQRQIVAGFSTGVKG